MVRSMQLCRVHAFTCKREIIEWSFQGASANHESTKSMEGRSRYSERYLFNSRKHRLSMRVKLCRTASFLFIIDLVQVKSFPLCSSSRFARLVVARGLVQRFPYRICCFGCGRTTFGFEHIRDAPGGCTVRFSLFSVQAGAGCAFHALPFCVAIPASIAILAAIPVLISAPVTVRMSFPLPISISRS